MPAPDAFGQVLLALTAVVVVGRLLGHGFRAIGQPAVIGEVVGGIVLGPSLLGQIAPDLSQFILPLTVAPFLGVIAQLGVILYMFLVGVDLNPGLLRGQVRATVAIAHASITVPFINFALFLGIAMSITAFPVLARILSERGMMTSRLGALALTCAAIGDVTAWCLLAFVVGVAQARIGNALLVAALTLVFIGVMFLAVRPVFAHLSAASGDGPPTQGTIAIVLVSMLLAALTTDAIGVHAIFGAFLLGAVIPHESALARSLKLGLHDLVTILLLPAFFALTGMRTQIGLVSGIYEWSICGLIVLNVGLDLGVISPTLFTMLVVMALVTTVATTPILQRVVPAPPAFSLPRTTEAPRHRESSSN